MEKTASDTGPVNDPAEIEAESLKYPFKYSRIENFEYPAGIRLAVNFSVNYDAKLTRRIKNEPIMGITQGEFGARVGIWRLMDLFDKYDINLTIFTPGRICELYPDSLHEAVSRGHELAAQPWERRVPSDIELQKDHLCKTTAAIADIRGKKPVGAKISQKLSLLKEEGYLYTAHPCADDMPYYIFDETGQYCMLNFPSANYILDDCMFFHFSWKGSGNIGQRLSDPCKVYDIWLSVFRQQYKMGRYMNICLHAFTSGRSLVIAMLEKLIVEMKKLPGVWFPTCEELAGYCIERYPQPVDVK